MRVRVRVCVRRWWAALTSGKGHGGRWRGRRRRTLHLPKRLGEFAIGGGGVVCKRVHSDDSRCGLKFQRRTWIRREIHVSIQNTSYTDTINYGTYRVVVARLFERPAGAVDARSALMHWLRRCAVGVDALAASMRW